MNDQMKLRSCKIVRMDNEENSVMEREGEQDIECNSQTRGEDFHGWDNESAEKDSNVNEQGVTKDLLEGLFHNFMSQMNEKMNEKLNEKFESQSEKMNENFEKKLNEKLDKVNEKLQQNSERIDGKLSLHLNLVASQIDGKINEVKDQMGELSRKIEENSSRLKEQIESEVRSEVEKVQIEVRSEVEKVQSEVRNEVEKVQSEVEKVQSEVRNEVGKVQSEVEKVQNEVRSEIGKVQQELNENVKINSERMTIIERHVLDVRSQIQTVSHRLKKTEASTQDHTRVVEKDKQTQSHVVDLTDKVDTAIPSTSSGGSNQGNLNVQNEQSPLQQNVTIPNVHVEPNVMTSTQNFILSELILPKFGNAPSENPLRYIREMEQFFELRSVPHKFKMSVIRQSLINDVAIWFDMQISKDFDYDTFKDLFISHYWDRSRQAEIRYEILNGKYEQRKHKSMVEYFIRLGQQAKFLEPPVPMEEFIIAIANHYPPEIRSAIVISRPHSVTEMMNLLKELQPNPSRQFAFMEGRREAGSAMKKTEQDHFLKGGAQGASCCHNSTSPQGNVDHKNQGWSKGQKREKIR